MTQKNTLLILAAISLAGIFSILFVTKFGVGTSPDSVVYIGAARNLMDGKGLTLPFGREMDTPITHHAPFYSSLLAIVTFPGIDPLVTARWVNAFLFGFLIFFVGASLLEMLPSSSVTPILGSFLILTAVPIVEIHAYAWTEPLFILLGFCGLRLIAAHLKNPRYVSLILASSLIALATLTRYAGLAFIGTGLVSILLLLKNKFSRKFLDAVIFAVVSTTPLFFWLGRNTIMAGTATSRVLAFHPVTKSHLLQSLDTVAGWLLISTSLPGLVKLLLILSILGACITFAVVIFRKNTTGKKSEGVENPFFVQLLGVFVIIYSSFLLVSISFLDANTPLDNRILSPLFVALLIIILYLSDAFFRLKKFQPLIKYSLILVSIIFSISYLSKDISWIFDNHANGLGFSSKVWQNSDFVVQINKLPSEGTFFSNAPQAVYILSGKSAQALPKERLSTTQQINQAYFSEISKTRTQIQTNDGFVIFFNNPQAGNQEYEQKMIELLSLHMIIKTTEGTIFNSGLND